MKPQVDSKKQQLNVYDIIQHALENQKFSSPYQQDPKVAYMGVLAEMSQPNTDVKQLGNTLFITHPKDKTAFFKALNADTAENFVDSSIAYGDYAANELGLRTIVTTYKGETFRNIMRSTFKKKPNPNFGYQIRKSKNGDDVVIMHLKD